MNFVHLKEWISEISCSHPKYHGLGLDWFRNTSGEIQMLGDTLECVSEALDMNDMERLFKTKRDSISWRLGRHGHYFGLIPTRLPNNRLVFDRGQVIDLLKSRGVIS